jgi:tellurite resistance protein
MIRLPVVPASFFGIVLGLAGLGNGWRLAAKILGLPSAIAEVCFFSALIVWLVVASLYLAKWVFRREEALAEFSHPVMCCFVGLAGVSTLLISVAAAPYSTTIAWILFWLGWIAQFGFAIYRTGTLWQGGRDANTTTPVLYLPLVAGNFVATLAIGILGHPDWGILFFGAGMFAWLAVESIILYRLYIYEPLPLPLRPLLGIQLAPPAVAAGAWLSINGGHADLIAQALIGYALLQGFLLLRLARWIAQQPFSASYWAFSFGVAALPTACLRMVTFGMQGPIADLALPLFAVANAFVLVLVVRTLFLLFTGRLLSPARLAPAVPAETR